MRVIVVGCGRWGSELARVLDRRGHGVTVVDPRADDAPALAGVLGPAEEPQGADVGDPAPYIGSRHVQGAGQTPPGRKP